jgi:uncharacterized protein YeaO (DUF488 family)
LKNLLPLKQALDRTFQFYIEQNAHKAGLFQTFALRWRRFRSMLGKSIRGASNMASIEIKRAYEPPSPKDGKRILVDRLWPRGVRKDKAALDLWSKDIAPTTPLRVWFDHRPDRFAEFKRRYRDELKSNPAVAEVLKHIGRRKATLVYAAHDTAVNHAVVLAEFLTKAQGKKTAVKKTTATKRSG